LKCDDFKTFEKQKSSLYLVISKEDYVKNLTLERFKGGLKFSCESLKTLQGVLEELKTRSLFESSKTILLTEIEAEKTTFFDPLLPLLNGIPKEIELVLIGKTLSKATKLYKACETYGVVLDVPEQKPWEVAANLQQWVLNYAKEAQKELSPHLAHLIVKQGGTDQSVLKNELDKLFSFLGERSQIKEEDIDLSLIKSPSDTGWQLGEALFQLDQKRALSVLDSQLRAGVAFIALLRQLRGQMVTGYQVLSLANQREEISLKYPYLRGALLEKTLKSATSFGAFRFKKALMVIDEIELKAKNSSLSDEFLATLLIGRLL
jgi:DNA polymerase-3 subunit delta